MLRDLEQPTGRAGDWVATLPIILQGERMIIIPVAMESGVPQALS